MENEVVLNARINALIAQREARSNEVVMQEGIIAELRQEVERLKKQLEEKDKPDEDRSDQDLPLPS